MDRRSLLAMFLSFGVYLAWQKYYIEPNFPTQASQMSQQEQKASGELTAESSQLKQSALVPKKAPKQALVSPQVLKVLSSLGPVEISDQNAIISEWKLNNYHSSLDAKSPLVDLSSVTQGLPELAFSLDDPHSAYLSQVAGRLTEKNHQIDWTYKDQEVELTRSIFWDNKKPYLDLSFSLEITGTTLKPQFLFVSINSRSFEKDPQAQDRQIIYYSNNQLERLPVKETIKQENLPPTGFIGLSTRYFLLALINQSPVQPYGLIQNPAPFSALVSLAYPITGKSLRVPMRIFFGPKDVDILRSVEPTLDRAVDFGWFATIAHPLLKFLKWLNLYFNNFGVSIIVLTLILKLLLFPITYKGMQSMKKASKLQPELQKLRQRYQNDKEQLNREMLQFMKTNGYNPFAGCLPLVLQMPIFIALYKVLYSAIDLYHAPFALWIVDLSSHDPFFVMPTLISIAMYVQQKMMPTPTNDPAQAKMMQFLPIIFGAFNLFFPAGLTLYWFVNTITSILQQYWINKQIEIAKN